MNRLSKILLFALTLMFVTVCLIETVTACPTCKDGMVNDPAHSSMVNGYFWSIIFMMSMPFLVFTGVAAYFYYEVRRARSRQAVTAQATSTDTGSGVSNKPSGPSPKSFCRVDVMKAFGRLLQIVGLVLLPLSMFMNLTDSFGATFHILQMLIMTAFGFAAFYLGRIMEGYAGR